jgi:hypothetical protein
VFFYLGVCNFVGVQFVERIILFILPHKYFPKKAYCQKVINFQSFWFIRSKDGSPINPFYF